MTTTSSRPLSFFIASTALSIGYGHTSPRTSSFMAPPPTSRNPPDRQDAEVRAAGEGGAEKPSGDRERRDRREERSDGAADREARAQPHHHAASQRLRIADGAAREAQLELPREERAHERARPEPDR